MPALPCLPVMSNWPSSSAELIFQSVQANLVPVITSPDYLVVTQSRTHKNGARRVPRKCNSLHLGRADKC